MSDLTSRLFSSEGSCGHMHVGLTCTNEPILWPLARQHHWAASMPLDSLQLQNKVTVRSRLLGMVPIPRQLQVVPGSFLEEG